MTQGIQQKITYDCDCFLTAYSCLKYQTKDNEFLQNDSILKQALSTFYMPMHILCY
jgi:hypothetical protein